MFDRKEHTYVVGDETIDKILRDPAHPLCQIAKLLPEGSVVLDIGAGNGMLGRVLQRAGKSVILDGIEPNEFAAGLAQPFYRTVYTGYAQDFSQEIQARAYDFVVLADVIEHIPDPGSFLGELVRNLNKATRVIISIPNVAFGGVRLALLNGAFDYVDSGLLESTHLRFFTLDSARRLFKYVHLHAKCIYFLQRSFYRMEFARKLLKASPGTILKLASKPNARAYQYLFVLEQEPCETAIKYCGVTAMSVMIDAAVARPAIKQFIRRWRAR